MINEIYVIQESGIPIYFHNQEQIVDGVQLMDDFYTLHAGFFAAIVQFGTELTQDELKYIVFNNRTYGVKKSKSVFIVFSENKQMDGNTLNSLEKLLDSASNFLDNSLEGKNLNIPFAMNEPEMDAVVNDFSKFLISEKIIADGLTIDPSKVKLQIKNFVFKAVGYEPGKCNIGPRERLMRLTIGMTSITVGMLLFALFIILQLPAGYIFFLTIPFAMGFIGIYQYFFKFCVSNGIRKTYNMT